MSTTPAPGHRASPAPSDFLAAFGEAAEAGATSVLCLTLSAPIQRHPLRRSGRLGLARELQARCHRRRHGGLAMTHGFAVLAAARALELGATPDIAASAAVDVGGRGHLVGALDTMRYLVKGAAFPGSSAGPPPFSAFDPYSPSSPATPARSHAPDCNPRRTTHARLRRSARHG